MLDWLDVAKLAGAALLILDSSSPTDAVFNVAEILALLDLINPKADVEDELLISFDEYRNLAQYAGRNSASNRVWSL